MAVRINPILPGILVIGLTLPATGVRAEGAKKGGSAAQSPNAVLWRDPGNLASRDLFYGPGGAHHQPHGPYTFVKEDLGGSNPKFVVRDRDGVKWKVKLGVEARPETVSTRLVWAVGYCADTDYFLRDLKVPDMPRLHRGQRLVAADGSMHNVRLKRENEKKRGDWQWRQDPFTATREGNGLRVMMALINNWDLKTVNNAVYQDHDSRQVYVVTDLGASFGTDNLAWPLSKAKGNLDSYSRSKFIRRCTPTSVDFYVPARPEFVYLLHPRNYYDRLRMQWIGKNIPRSDARWIGNLLAHLSSRQIQDAFRAAGYSQPEVEAFSAIVERRIALLTQL